MGRKDNSRLAPIRSDQLPNSPSAQWVETRAYFVQ